MFKISSSYRPVKTTRLMKVSVISDHAKELFSSLFYSSLIIVGFLPFRCLGTGNFKCMVKTGAECFALCQEHGCFEWSFTSFMASTDTQLHQHYRCRCVQNICLYNYVRAKDRAYSWAGVGIGLSFGSRSSHSVCECRLHSSLRSLSRPWAVG